MNVLSLFDGKSSAFTACEIAGIKVNNYYSAEIDKYAIQVSNAIHPNQTRLGDVTKWREWDIDWASINMIFGGFPCQAWSMAGKQLGDKDKRGMLFWVMLDIMKHVRGFNPKVQFLIENVKMKNEFEEYITYHMNNAVGDVHKILINSALVSAQNRNRYYWTSFPVTKPEDRGIVLADVIEKTCDKKYYLSEKILAGFWNKKERRKSMRSGFDNLNVCNLQNKASCITARYYKTSMSDPFIIQRPRGNNSGGKRGINGKTPTLSACSFEQNNFVSLAGLVRRLTPRECFRLQTTPKHYIDKILSCGVSNTQLYKIAGNGWTDEVIAHILKGAY